MPSIATVIALLVFIPHEYERSETPCSPQSFPTFVGACNDGVLPVTLSPPAEAQASISMATALYLSLYLSYLIGVPFNELRLAPGCRLV